MTTLETRSTPAPPDAAPAAEPDATDPGLTGETVTLNVFRGTPDDEQGEVCYQVPGVIGMVVLDAIHYIQHNLDTDLAARRHQSLQSRG
jgi:hypothetical protein